MSFSVKARVVLSDCDYIPLTIKLCPASHVDSPPLPPSASADIFGLAARSVSGPPAKSSAPRLQSARTHAHTRAAPQDPWRGGSGAGVARTSTATHHLGHGSDLYIDRVLHYQLATSAKDWN
jgi:hypothetical protein